MLHQVIPSILLILGYVAAAAALSDEECTVEFVALDTDKDAPAALDKFNGVYQVIDEQHRGNPIYRNEANTDLCMFTGDLTTSAEVALGDCQTKTVEYYFSDIEGTCFSGSLNDMFTVFDQAHTNIGVADLQSKNLGLACSECREILAGDLKGKYNLVDKHSPYCKEADEDGCVYEHKDTKATVCFKKDAAGQDTMLHDETCAL